MMHPGIPRCNPEFCWAPQMAAGQLGTVSINPVRLQGHAGDLQGWERELLVSRIDEWGIIPWQFDLPGGSLHLKICFGKIKKGKHHIDLMENLCRFSPSTNPLNLVSGFVKTQWNKWINSAYPMQITIGQLGWTNPLIRFVGWATEWWMVSGRQGEPNGYHNDYHHLQFVPWSNYIVSWKNSGWWSCINFSFGSIQFIYPFVLI